MNFQKVKTALRKAYQINNTLDSLCGLIAAELQPFFDNEISVCFQPGDGFVVVWEDGIYSAPSNVPVEDAIENLKNDKTYYI